MASTSPAITALTLRLLRALTGLNLLVGVLIALLFVMSLIAHDSVMSALGIPAIEVNTRLMRGGQLIMCIGVAGTAVTHAVLTRFSAIVSAVVSGDPFVRDNAVRLDQVAWAVFGLELLHIAVGIIAATVSTAAIPLNFGVTFSPTPWLAILLLFVLARVFAHGAHMREEIAGMV